MRNFSNRLSILLFAGIFFAECVVVAQVPTVIVRENDLLPGGNGEIVSSLNHTAQNDNGGYAFTLTTDPSTSTVWGNATGVGDPAIIISEGTFGPLVQSSFESFFGFSDSGLAAYSALNTDTSSGTSGLDGMWVNETIIFNDGDPVPTLPGMFSTFNSRPGITSDGQPYWIGGYGPGTSTDFRALFFGTTPTIVLKGGDNIVGVAEPITDEGLDFDFRMSSLGTNYIIQVDVDAPSSNDIVIAINGEAMMVGGSLLREGTTVPPAIGGIDGEAWANFDFMGITETGSYMLTGDTGGDFEKDEFVLIDDVFVLREGDAIGDFAVAGAIEAAAYNEAGDWAVIWDVLDAAVEVEALIVNGEVVLKEGDLVDWNGDGIIDALDQGATLDSFTGINPLSISEPDASGNVYLCFIANCDVDGSQLSGGFRVRAGSPEVFLASFDVTAGDYVSGGAIELLESDDADLNARRGRLDIQSRVFVEFVGENAPTNPSSFEFSIESSVFARTNVVQSIDLFDFDANQWEEVDVRNATRFFDSTVDVQPTGDLSRFASPTGTVRTRVRYQSDSPRQNFSANIDQVTWTVE